MAQIEVNGTPYELEERPCGDGRFAEVYRAVRVGADRQGPEVVAAKVLKERYTLRTADMREAFVQELQALHLLRDVPRIVRQYSGEVLDLPGQPGRWYLALEYIEGNTLLREVQPYPHGLPDDGRTLTLALGLCQALHEAHEKGVLHYDLKPQHVFLQGDDVKLIDWNRAVFRRGAQEVPLVQPRDGAEWEAALALELEDLAATLFTLYTGLDVATGNKAREIITARSHMDRSPRRIRPALLEFDPEREVSSETWAILRRALSPQARERYRTTAELREALAQRGPALGANVARILTPPPPDRKVAPSPGPEPQAVVSVWDPQRMLRAHLEAARDARERRDWDTMREQAEKARQLEPGHGEATDLFNEATAHRRQQQVQHHLDLARRAERQRDWDTVQREAGQALALEPDQEEARRLFDTASSRRARVPRAWWKWAVGAVVLVLVALGGWKVVVRVQWERLSDPQKALQLLKQGKDAFENEQFRPAARLLEQAAALKPDEYQIHHWLCKTYYFQARRNDALREFRRVQELNPASKVDKEYADDKVEELTRDGR